jgi:shikimate dehydrogenase
VAISCTFFLFPMAASYGIIGYPLGHSFSPAYFADKFQREGIDAVYKTYSLPDISALSQVLQDNPSLQGLNVTIPHKQAVIPYLNALDVEAEAIGAVNCIDIRNGITRGYNTDATGFELSLLPLLSADHTHALVLGTGGASLAVAYVLDKLGIAFRHVSRNAKQGQYTYAALTPDIIQQHKLLINTTPLGMHPDISSLPALAYEAIGASHLLYDLIYNPEETAFLAAGRQQGAAVKNGLEMLQVQAEASWRIWNS